MSPGVTFERVYRGLKERVVAGEFRPGEQLEPSALSADLAASITPVRDALHRLVGERLIWTPRGDGFRMPIYTEAGLRDLYGWSQRLLHLALSSRAPGTAGDTMSDNDAGEPEDAFGPAAATARLFEAVARLAGSAEHDAAISALNDRLGAVRSREVAMFDPEAELAEIQAALASGDVARLRQLIPAFHRRRIAKVPLLLTRLQPEF